MGIPLRCRPSPNDAHLARDGTSSKTTWIAVHLNRGSAGTEYFLINGKVIMGTMLKLLMVCPMSDAALPPALSLSAAITSGGTYTNKIAPSSCQEETLQTEGVTNGFEEQARHSARMARPHSSPLPSSEPRRLSLACESQPPALTRRLCAGPRSECGRRRCGTSSRAFARRRPSSRRRRRASTSPAATR